MRRAEALAVLVLAFASVAAAWAAPRPVPAAAALAIPAVWGGLLLYVPFRFAGRWAWGEVVRAAPRPEDRRALAQVLLLAFGLLIWGLDWGLADSSWAADELRPDWVRDVLHQGFGSGWYDKYPWLHYAVLAVPVSAFELADRLGLLPIGSAASWAGQLALMRAVSVLMALGTLVGAHLCSIEMIWTAPRGALDACAPADAALRLLRQDGEPGHASALLVRLGDAGLPAHPARRPAAGLCLARHRGRRVGGDEGPGVREPRAGRRRGRGDHGAAARRIGLVGEARRRAGRSARLGRWGRGGARPR